MLLLLRTVNGQKVLTADNMFRSWRYDALLCPPCFSLACSQN